MSTQRVRPQTGVDARFAGQAQPARGQGGPAGGGQARGPVKQVPASSPQGTTVRKVSAPAAGAPPGPAAAPAPPQAAAHELAARLARLEAAVQRLARLEQSLSDTNRSLADVSGRAQTLADAVGSLSDRVEACEKALRTTVLHGARSSHTCKTCGSQGFLAASIRCTQCGADDWWGFWPKKA